MSDKPVSPYAAGGASEPERVVSAPEPVVAESEPIPASPEPVVAKIVPAPERVTPPPAAPPTDAAAAPDPAAASSTGNPAPTELQRRGAWLLVGIQGLLFAAIGATVLLPRVGPALPSSPIAAVVLAVLGGAGVMFSGWHLGRALTPLPLPNGAGLAAHGVYRWMRHPMYSSIVALAAGVAASEGAVLPWVLAAVLLAFFDVKARAEENWLVRAYPGYEAYAARTGKFLPWLGRRTRW